MDCSCINICLHSCAPWKSKRHWVSCSGAPEEYPRHPYIQDDVNTEKDVLGPSRNLFGGFVCRGFIISKKNKLYATITGRLHSDSILEYLYLIEIPANNIIQEAESWPFPIYGQYYNITTWWISRVCSIRWSENPSCFSQSRSNNIFHQICESFFLFVPFCFVECRFWSSMGWRQFETSDVWSYDFGRKKHYKRHLRIVYIYVLKKLSIEINFSFSVSRFQKPTLKRYPPGAEPESVVKERGESQTSTKDPRQGIFR